LHEKVALTQHKVLAHERRKKNLDKRGRHASHSQRGGREMCAKSHHYHPMNFGCNEAKMEENTKPEKINKIGSFPPTHSEHFSFMRLPLTTPKKKQSRLNGGYRGLFPPHSPLERSDDVLMSL
jgi:hypothetical protein